MLSQLRATGNHHLSLLSAVEFIRIVAAHLDDGERAYTAGNDDQQEQPKFKDLRPHGILGSFADCNREITRTREPRYCRVTNAVAPPNLRQDLTSSLPAKCLSNLELRKLRLPSKPHPSLLRTFPAL